MSISVVHFILLMEEILHDLGCIKPCKEWDKLPTSPDEFTGFLNHQQYHPRVQKTSSQGAARADLNAIVAVNFVSHLTSLPVFFVAVDFLVRLVEHGDDGVFTWHLST